MNEKLKNGFIWKHDYYLKNNNVRISMLFDLNGWVIKNEQWNKLFILILTFFIFINQLFLAFLFWFHCFRYLYRVKLQWSLYPSSFHLFSSKVLLLMLPLFFLIVRCKLLWGGRQFWAIGRTRSRPARCRKRWSILFICLTWDVSLCFWNQFCHGRWTCRRTPSWRELL